MEFFDISMAFLMKIWLNSEVLHTKHWQATLLFLEKFVLQRGKLMKFYNLLEETVHRF